MGDPAPMRDIAEDQKQNRRADCQLVSKAHVDARTIAPIGDQAEHEEAELAGQKPQRPDVEGTAIERKGEQETSPRLAAEMPISVDVGSRQRNGASP